MVMLTMIVIVLVRISISSNRGGQTTVKMLDVLLI